MFTDRLWVVKAACALGLFTLLSFFGGRALEKLRPPLERIAVFSEDLRDKTVIVWGRKVLTADAAGFEVGSRVGPIRVLTPHPPPVGAYVSAVARPTGTRTLTASSVEINAGWAWKRPLNYGLSALVVLVYLWSIRDRFRWNIESGVFRSRY